MIVVTKNGEEMREALEDLDGGFTSITICRGEKDSVVDFRDITKEQALHMIADAVEALSAATEVPPTTYATWLRMEILERCGRDPFAI